MSRSYRHTMVHGNSTSASEKQDKRLNNRRLRRRVRQNLDTCTDFEAVVLPVVSEVSNPWSMAKDGKRYSKWLAGYRATLEKVTRTRDGRTRYFLAVTEATLCHHDKEISRRRYLFGFLIFNGEVSLEEIISGEAVGVRTNGEVVTIEKLRERHPLNNALDIIRK